MSKYGTNVTKLITQFIAVEFFQNPERRKQVLEAAILIIGLLALPAVCMWLWNWLMPEIFGLQNIGYWQAAGLMALSSCFFYRRSSRA